jgi:predicted porin
MKKLATALILSALLPKLSHAQSSVQLYGSLDEGVTYVNNEHGGHAAVVGPVAVPDFLGFRGSEDLGGGLKAIFRLETAFNTATGANLVPADIFSRVAYVGLSSPAGTMTLGRQFDLTNDTLTQNSNGIIQYSYYLFHPANLDNTALTEVNNAIKYTTPTFGGLSLTAMYGFNDSSAQPGRVFAVDAIYNQGPLRASAVYSGWHDRTVDLASKLGYTSFLGQALGTGKTFFANSTDITGLSARYALNDSLTVHGMLTHVSIEAPAGSAHMATGELGVDVMTSRFNTINVGGFLSSLTGAHYQEVGLGDVYSLSKQTIVYAQTAYQHANGRADAAISLLAPSNTANQLLFRVGVHHFF